MTSLRDALTSQTPCTVGAISDMGALTQSFTTAECDLIELRLDALGCGPEVVTFAERHQNILPLLITARGPAEGGVRKWSLAEREEALTHLLPLATAIDIELRDLEALATVWERAKEAGVIRVASAHDFEQLPSEETILSLLDAMADGGAEVAKVAFHLANEDDLARLAATMRTWGRLPVSFMGMGPFGPASRALAVLSGSVLNYGFLGQEPTAPGQWPAHLLKEVIACSPR